MRIEAFLFLPAARHRLSRILMPAQLIPHLGVERQAARGYKEFGARSPQRGVDRALAQGVLVMPALVAGTRWVAHP
jgi:hypothetical protein